jgi:hypothetical protein
LYCAHYEKQRKGKTGKNYNYFLFFGVKIHLKQQKYSKEKFSHTVKLGYNELDITNKKNMLVGLGHFYGEFSRL